MALPATLAGRPDATPVAWLVSATDGSRIQAFWPSGYRAVFAPDLRILADDGTEALREGDYVDGGCLASGPNSLNLQPPFLAVQVDCGPMPRAECLSGRVHAIAGEQGWPARELRSLTFLTPGGEYEVEFEDGSRARGVSTDF